MVTREGLSFQFKRISGTLKTVTKNRMAVVGLILLFGFVFMALAAPLLTPYTPTTEVSGPLAQPDWVMNYPDGYYLSRNIIVVADPLFNSPSSLQAWTVTGPSSVLANLQLTYAPGVFPQGLGSKGSLQLEYTGTGSGSVWISRTFNYPYRGPPARFIGSAQYLIGGANQSRPVDVQVFIQRVGGDVFTLLNENNTVAGVWAGNTGLASNSKPLEDFLGLTGSGFTDPSQIIFSARQDYVFGMEIVFSGHQKINIDNFQLSILGTAWGILGTDFQGADVYTQLIYGARISLLVGLLSAAIGISLGLLVGLLAGFLGKFVDEVLMRFTDMMLVIPSLPLLIVLIAVLGASIWNLILVIGFLGWMGFARIVRSQVLTLRERPFIEAAKAAGAGPGRIITRHVFPNIVSLTYVNLALSVPAAILSESALAFLGLSDPTLNSWGHMFENVDISGTITRLPPAWWWVLPPGFGIALVSLSFILIGYALDEIFNPRLRRRR